MNAIMDHGTRRSILETLHETPGLTVGEVAGALGVHYKTALHHARLLARHGHVVLAPDGGRVRCYLPGERRDLRPEARALEALHAIACGAGTPATLSRALGIPRGTAGSLLRRLERAALAVRTGGGWVVTRPEAFTGGGPVGASWNGASSAR